MHKHIIWGTIGLILGVIVGIFAVNNTNESLMPAKVTNSTMHTSMMQSTTMLGNLEGDDFEKTFLKEMIDHHEGAIDMAKLVLSKSKRPELQDLANNIIVAQTNEILQMQRWLGDWFNK